MMDRQCRNALIRLVTLGAFGLPLMACAQDDGPDAATTAGALTSRTAGDRSDVVVATAARVAATDSKKTATATVVTTTPPPTPVAPPPTPPIVQAIEPGAIRRPPPPILSPGPAIQIPVCPASYNAYDYPRSVDKFSDTWPDIHPAAINNLGQVAGSFRPAANQKLKGFVRQVNGSFTPAPWYGPDYDVTLTAINDLGQFVGYVGGMDDPYGFFDSHGDTLEGYAPLAINNRGQSVGIHQYSTWGGAFHYTDGFLRDANGQLTNLGKFQPVAINNLGQIAGYFPSEDSSIFDPGAIYLSAVRDSDGRFTYIKYVSAKVNGVLLNGVYPAHPVAINDLSQVVGYYQDNDSHYHGFVADATGAVTPIDDPNTGYANNYPTAINNLGQVVGWVDNGDVPREQFVRDANGAFAFFEPAGPDGTNIDEAKGINDLGEEVGIYNDGAASKGFVAGSYFVEPFAGFSVTKVDIAPNTGALTVWGGFTPCPGRTLSPDAKPVLLKLYQPGLAWASIAIPAGSFVPQTGKYEYHGVLHGVTVDAYLWGPLPDNHWDFRLYASGLSGLPGTNPLTVSLAIGDNTGSAKVDNASIH